MPRSDASRRMGQIRKAARSGVVNELETRFLVSEA